MTPLPPTRRDDVVDILHGVEVPDPYRWLEDGDAAEVRQWVAAQNEHTREALDARPDRGWWHERLVALMQLPVVMAVQVRGDRLFCLERPAGAEQFLLTRRSADRSATHRPSCCSTRRRHRRRGERRSTGSSRLARRLAGRRRHERRRHARTPCCGCSTPPTARDRGEAIPDTRACSVAWEPDGSGFAYTRYPPGDQYHRTVHHHVLGDAVGRRPGRVGRAPRPRRRGPTSRSRRTARWLLVHVLVGWAAHRRPPARPGDAARWTTAIAGVEVTTGAPVRRRRRRRWSASPRSTRRRAGSCGCRSTTPAVGRRGRRSSPRATPCSASVAVRGDDLLVVGDASRRRHGLAPRRRRDAARRASTGLGDVVAVAGLSADRDDRRRVRRRRRLRRADRAVAGRQRRRRRRGLDDARDGRRRRADDDRQPGRVPVARRHDDRACS